MEITEYQRMMAQLEQLLHEMRLGLTPSNPILSAAIIQAIQESTPTEDVIFASIRI